MVELCEQKQRQEKPVITRRYRQHKTKLGISLCVVVRVINRRIVRGVDGGIVEAVGLGVSHVGSESNLPAQYSPTTTQQAIAY